MTFSRVEPHLQYNGNRIRGKPKNHHFFPPYVTFPLIQYELVSVSEAPQWHLNDLVSDLSDQDLPTKRQEKHDFYEQDEEDHSHHLTSKELTVLDEYIGKKSIKSGKIFSKFPPYVICFDIFPLTWHFFSTKWFVKLVSSLLCDIPPYVIPPYVLSTVLGLIDQGSSRPLSVDMFTHACYKRTSGY